MEPLRVAKAGGIEEGGQKFVKASGKGVYLHRIGGRFFAAESGCPCPLSGGILNRIVTHDGAPCVQCDAKCYTLAFDLGTGRNTRGFNYSIEVYPTRIEDDTILVDL